MRRAARHTPFHEEREGGLATSNPNDRKTAVEMFAQARLDTGRWRLAVGVTTADWGIGIMTLSLVRKVRQWYRRRHREAEHAGELHE